MNNTLDTPTPATLDVQPLQLGGRTFRSRLILGTGKYTDLATMQAALDASGTEMVTVALRRGSFDPNGKADLVAAIDQSRSLLLPNTAGCYNADEAIRTARLGRELGGWDWGELGG